MSAFRTLVWKDARLARGYLIAAFAVLIAPYVVLWFRHHRPAPGGMDWMMLVHYCGLIGGLGTIVVATLLAGASVAAERTDRSAEFLVYLPARRSQRLASKLATVTVPTLLLAAANPLLILNVIPNGWPSEGSADAVVIVTLACSLILVIGVAWLGSTLVSAAAALLLGLLAPFFVACLYFLSANVVEAVWKVAVNHDDWFGTVYRPASVVIGLVALFLGCVVFCQRETA